MQYTEAECIVAAAERQSLSSASACQWAAYREIKQQIADAESRAMDDEEAHGWARYTMIETTADLT